MLQMPYVIYAMSMFGQASHSGDPESDLMGHFIAVETVIQFT